MKAFTYEVTKVIVVTVEAKNIAEATAQIACDIDDGEYAYSFDRAEPKFNLLNSEVLK